MRRPLLVADAASHAVLTLWCSESLDSEGMLADPDLAYRGSLALSAADRFLPCPARPRANRS
jgi:hypothetical protein